MRLMLTLLVAATCMDETGTVRLYDDSCCCTSGWCAAVDDRAVKEVPGGWRVTIAPGTHPKMLPGVYFVPGEQARVSRDGRWHVCGMRAVRCFYKVGGAV